MRFLSALSILLPLIANLKLAKSQTLCDENEVYTNCASSTCFEETCVDVLFPKPGLKKCTRDCKQGCQCEEGYFRNHDGRCVDELTCIMCGYQEDWIEYSADDDDKFEMICDDLMDEEFEDEEEQPPSFPPGTFDEIEMDGGGICHCAKNTFRSMDGLCVSKESCLECGMNEIYESCGSSSCWEYTCDDVLIPLRERLMIPCTLDCRSGCKCHPGFYRQTSSGECVTAATCLE